MLKEKNRWWEPVIWFLLVGSVLFGSSYMDARSRAKANDETFDVRAIRELHSIANSQQRIARSLEKMAQKGCRP